MKMKIKNFRRIVNGQNINFKSQFIYIFLISNLTSLLIIICHVLRFLNFSKVIWNSLISMCMRYLKYIFHSLIFLNSETSNVVPKRIVTKNLHRTTRSRGRTHKCFSAIFSKIFVIFRALHFFLFDKKTLFT